MQQLKEKICRNYNITSVKLLYFYKIGVNSNINLNLNLKIKAGLLNIKHCITHLMVTDGMSGKDGAAYRQIFCKVLNENITFIPIPFLSTVKKKDGSFLCIITFYYLPPAFKGHSSRFSGISASKPGAINLN